MSRYQGWSLVACLAVWVLAGCDSKPRAEVECESDADCETLEICQTGLCRAVQCKVDEDCAIGERCFEYLCEESPPCQSDADCAAPTPVCDPASGHCVACTPECAGSCCGDDGCGGTCPDTCAATGQTCDPGTCNCEGTCQPACTGRQCGPDGCGDECQPGCSGTDICGTDGLCHPVGCVDDTDCAAPTPLCDTDSGLCVACLSADDCPSGQVCSGGVCADAPACSSDSQCEMGQICVDGACLPGCRGNRDCPTDWSCKLDLGPNGTCVQCEVQGDCGAGENCEDWHCVPYCTSDNHCTPLYCDQASHDCVECRLDEHCASGDICRNFACVTGCREDGDCPSGHCDLAELICVACLTDDHCSLGTLCVGGECVVGCGGDRDCPTGLQCDTDLGDYGTCVECLLDGDCDPAYRCVAGLCEFFCAVDEDCQAPNPACDETAGVCVACVINDHCLPGTICIAQECLPGCVNDRDCPTGEVCAPQLGEHGSCVDCLETADCPTGYTCDGNVCRLEGSDMVRLPGGAFVRGSDSNEGEADERPETTITVPTFYLDRTEVTNDQFRACVQAGACAAPLDTTAYGDPSLGAHPVVHVTWDHARDFCVWMGKGLPTEARWERAARGLSPGERTYPWGEATPSCALVNFSGCGGTTDPVGTHPTGATPEGVLDLAGNVYEWVYDYYGSDYYSTSTVTDDPMGPSEGSYDSARGGAFDSPASNIRVANRAGYDPAVGYPNVGFRCALLGAPTAAFSVWPESGPYATTVFAFDASASSDPNQPVDLLEVRWDWEDDGAFDSNWSTAKIASHRYAFAGIFRVRLEVRDPDANVSEASTEVVAEGAEGWDGAPCEDDTGCAHGFRCIFDLNTLSNYCRESCIPFFEPECHITGMTCNLTWPLGTACTPGT